MSVVGDLTQNSNIKRPSRGSGVSNDNPELSLSSVAGGESVKRFACLDP